MYSREELAHDLRKLGIMAADTVMLHASVRAVGEIAGGPDQIHLAFKDVDSASLDRLRDPDHRFSANEASRKGDFPRAILRISNTMD